MESKHILVVEDETSTRSLLTETLTSAGYRVTSVGDGNDALKTSRADPPDLVVCDLVVPGLDGLQLIPKLKSGKDFAAPVVIVVTGRKQDKDRQAAMDAGADVFLTKPVVVKNLLASVREHLPIEEPEPEPEQKEQTPQKHILVLEDEPSTLLLLEEILAGAGYRVTGVDSGTRALKAVRSDPPDLVLSDLTVPGIDGFQFTGMLQRDGNFTAPVVVLSGRTSDEDKRRALEAGASAFLNKPVDREKLLATIAEQLAPKE